MTDDIILQKIMGATGLSADEIDKKISDKQRELSGLVSREGAAYIVAKELGLELFERVRKKTEIKNITAGLKNLTLSARVFKIFDTREFEYNGKKSKVANILLADGTGTLRFSLWDNQLELLEKLKPGIPIEIRGAYTKTDNRGGIEMRMGKYASVRVLEDSEVPKIDLTEKILRANISEVKEGGTYELRAAIVQVFDNDPVFEVCPQCNGRVKFDKDAFKCKTHGAVQPHYSVVVSGVIDDGTENMRAVFFRDAALKLLNQKLENVIALRANVFDSVDLLGKEFLMTGRVRRNQIFDRLEFVVDKVEDVNVRAEAEALINKLPKGE